MKYYIRNIAIFITIFVIFTIKSHYSDIEIKEETELCIESYIMTCMENTRDACIEDNESDINECISLNTECNKNIAEEECIVYTDDMPYYE